MRSDAAGVGSRFHRFFFRTYLFSLSGYTLCPWKDMISTDLVHTLKLTELWPNFDRIALNPPQAASLPPWPTPLEQGAATRKLGPTRRAKKRKRWDCPRKIHTLKCLSLGPFWSERSFSEQLSEFWGIPNLPKIPRYPQNTAFTQTFFEKFAQRCLLPCDTKKETQWKLFRKTCSDDFLILGGLVRLLQSDADAPSRWSCTSEAATLRQRYALKNAALSFWPLLEWKVILGAALGIVGHSGSNSRKCILRLNHVKANAWSNSWRVLVT